MFRSLPACATVLALVLAAGAAGSAHAAPTWLDETGPFGDVPSRPGDARAAMAPDGTIVLARFSPAGALEVRERAPGGPLGATITIPPVAVDPQPFPNLQVLVGANGTAAVLTDVGNIRYAAMRAPGGRWTDLEVIGLSGAGPGQAAIAPSGVLWIVGRVPDDVGGLAVVRMAPGAAIGVTRLPAPPPGAQHLARALTVAPTGGAHALYIEQRVTREGEDCARTTAVIEVDVSGAGAVAVPTVLDAFTTTGRGPAPVCPAEVGEVLLDPLLATDEAGADTVVYSVLSLATFEVRVQARHRAHGGPWPDRAQAAEAVTGDIVAEKLLGGPGAPLVVARSAGGKLISARAADGVWTPPAVLVGLEGAGSYDAARTGAGTTVFAWVEGGAQGRIVGRVLSADGTLGERDRLSAEGLGATMLAVGGDAEGNATALYSRLGDEDYTLRMNGYDAAGPRLTSVNTPPRPETGAAAPFSVVGVDVWSGPLRTATWDFGDGTGAAGLAVDHAYSSGGPRTVRVRAEDESGNATIAERVLTVAGAPAVPDAPVSPDIPDSPAAPGATPSPPTGPTQGGPPPDRRAPLLSGVAISARRGRAPVLTLTTNERGSLRATLARTVPGVRSGGRCVARGRARGQRCTRTLARRTVSRSLSAGRGQVTLPRLAAGTWTVTAIVTDIAGNRSSARRLNFRVA